MQVCLSELDAIIEAIAVSLCESDGKDPHERIMVQPGKYPGGAIWVDQWTKYSPAAWTHYQGMTK